MGSGPGSGAGSGAWEAQAHTRWSSSYKDVQARHREAKAQTVVAELFVLEITAKP